MKDNGWMAVRENRRKKQGKQSMKENTENTAALNSPSVLNKKLPAKK